MDPLQSGDALGGDGRGRAVVGDKEIVATSFREVSGVSGSGAGDTAMGFGENSIRVMEVVSGIHDTSTVNERSALADGDVMASTGAFGFQAPRGGIGTSGPARRVRVPQGSRVQGCKRWRT